MVGDQNPRSSESDSSLLRSPTGVIDRTESLEQFRELVQHLEQVFWIKKASRKEVLYVSPAYEKIWGRTCQSLYDDIDSLYNSIHPEDRVRIDGERKIASDGDACEEEFRIIRPDGDIRWIRSRSYPVRNRQGEIQRHAGIDEDITELKLAEKEKSRLAAIFELSEGALVSISVDGLIIGWNQGAERQYGYTAEEIMGHPISVLFPPDHYPEYLEIMKKVRRGEPSLPYETVRLRKDGTLINMSVSISPIENRSGQVIGASKTGHDISRIKKLEAQFIESQKMEVIGQLAGGVAHDFNNILAVIIGYTDLLAQDLPPEHPFLKYTEEIRHASERASGLTRQLLVFSRKQTVQPVVLNLNEVVASMDKMLRRFVDENIEMTLVCAEETGQIKADSGYIGQVLMNLIINARDAMPNGGKLTIETSTAVLEEEETHAHAGAFPGRYVVLSVTDTGLGMTDEIKGRIFEPFFTTKAPGKGTGLGLTTCQTIVQQSGGFIEVISELAQGSCFRIFFPRIDQAADPLVQFHKTGPLRRGTETLLFVEDEPSLRQLGQSALQTMGYKVLLAATGEEGLRMARDHQGEPIRLVITDVIMPVMGGKVMAEWLKTSFPDLKVLFTSGYTDDAIARHGVLNEDLAFLPKPYTRSTLARKVREILDAP